VRYRNVILDLGARDVSGGQYGTHGLLYLMPRPSAKEKLLEAAMASFRFESYKSCSIEDIAAKAGVFKGSFYNHFKSKEALAVEVINHYVEEIVLPLLALEGPPSAIKRLRAHFEKIAVVQNELRFPGCMMANFSAEISSLTPDLCSALDQTVDLWCRSIAKVIRQAQTEGSVSKELKAGPLSRFLINSFEGALIRARVLRSQQPFNDFLTVTFKAILSAKT
jgi:TetR/AcrR family transcriptional regulator, transcriptional repressor for nem operon